MRLCGRPRRFEFVTAFVGAYADEALNAGGVAVVLNGEDSATIRRISRAVATSDATAAAYEGVLTALREARALGAGHVAIFCDSDAVVAHLNGRLPVPGRFRRPFVQARKLMRAFTWTGIRHGNGRRLRDARGAAFAAASSGASRLQGDLRTTLQLSFAV